MDDPTKWSQADMDRVRQAVNVIRNPLCTDAVAVELIVSLMNLAEMSGQVTALGEARAVLAGGAQC